MNFWSWNIYDWYAWLTGFYTYEPKDGNKFNNHHRIRKTNEILSIVASEVFYDNSKFENCYDMTNEIIKEKGIRYVHFDGNGKPLSKDKTKKMDIINLLLQSMLFQMKNKFFLYMQ